jgi:hypothetical protein
VIPVLGIRPALLPCCRYAAAVDSSACWSLACAGTAAAGRFARGDRAGQAIGGRRRHPAADAQSAVRHARYGIRRRRRAQVATNAHVIQEAVDEAAGETLVIVVRSADAKPQQRPARVVAVDKGTISRCCASTAPLLPALTLHEAEPVREGQSVAFTGFPIGGASGCRRSRTAASFRRSRRSSCRGPMPASSTPGSCSRSGAGSFDIYQLDATAYPGQQRWSRSSMPVAARCSASSTWSSSRRTRNRSSASRPGSASPFPCASCAS